MRNLATVLILLLSCTSTLAKDEPAAADAKAKAKADVAKHIALLKSDDAGRRFAAAVELGKLRHPDAVPSLLGVLAGDGDLFVRRACARALGEIRRPQAVPGLIEALADGEIFVALQASKALTLITGVSHGFRGARTAEARLEVQKQWRAWWEKLPPSKRADKTPWVPAEETPKRPEPPATDLATLVKQLTSDEAGERFTAAVKLGQLRDTRAVDALCARLACDPDHFVRRACARSLGAIGRREAVPALIDALTDKEIYVAHEACRSLKVITGKAPDFTVEAGEGEKPGEFPTVEQRREIQTSYRTWWEEEKRRRAALKEGEASDGK